MLGQEEEEKEIPRSGNAGGSPRRAVTPSLMTALLFLPLGQIRGSVLPTRGKITRASAQFSCGALMVQMGEHHAPPPCPAAQPRQELRKSLTSPRQALRSQLVASTPGTSSSGVGPHTDGDPARDRRGARPVVQMHTVGVTSEENLSRNAQKPNTLFTAYFEPFQYVTLHLML